MFTTEFLADLRRYMRDKIAYAQYAAGETIMTADVESASILDDGRICVDFIIDTSIGAGKTISEIRLYDAQDILLAAKAETIACDSNLSSLYYRFYFTVEEVLSV